MNSLNPKTPQNPINPTDRTEINRANARHSTGPKSAPGKKRSALNALRHGLTGQTVILPTDDLAAYKAFCARFHADLKPVGMLEEQFVQTVADTQWRLNRLRSWESNLLALDFGSHAERIVVADNEIHAALAMAASVRGSIDDLARLSLYEQRLNRTLNSTIARLEALQQTRRNETARQMNLAIQHHKMNKQRKIRWNPADDGFEFSLPEIDQALGRATRHEAALFYEARS